MSKIDILNKKILQYFLSKNIVISNAISKEYLDQLLLNLSTKLQAELKIETIKELSKKIQVKEDSSCITIAKFYVKVFHTLSILLDILEINDSTTISINKITKKMLKELSFSEKSENIFPNIDSFYHNNYLHDNQFHHMSKSNKKRYEKDLKCFYISFTGKKEIPSHVKAFHDITISDYSEEPNICIHNYLFYEYGSYLKSKIKVMLEIQKELYNILYKIFCVKEKTIQPDLTDDKLNGYINQTRKLIIKLWNECDEGYTHGIKLMERIMEDLILKGIISQQKKIIKKLDKVYSQGLIEQNELFITSQDLSKE